MISLSWFGRALPLLALPVLLIPALAPKTPERSVAILGSAAATARVQYDRLPLTFERNQGQADPAVRYLARGPGYGLFLTPTEAVFQLPPGPKANGTGPGHNATAVLRMMLTGARRDVEIEALDLQPGKANYLLGNDQTQWRRDIARYGKVRYRAVYPGIDLVYYGSQRELEYDFVVAPGADPAQIAVRFDGLEGMRLDDAGNLVLTTANGDLRQHKPIAYQTIAGKRRPVTAHYRLQVNRQVSFVVGGYDRNWPLVIDPVLSYSTYLGGGEAEVVPHIAVDAAGNSYIIGSTYSADFPLKAPLQERFEYGRHDDPWDVFLAKLNPKGDALVYSTYLGGTANETAGGIAVDAAGNAYVGGCTASTNFPLKAPLQSQLVLKGPGRNNAFIAKLSPTGSSLVYSTYLGGSDDCGTGIAVDGKGAAYVLGITTEGGMTFPPGSFQPGFGGGMKDAFLVKLNAAGSAVVYGTYLGGSDEDYGWGLAVDAAGNAYVTGGTYSLDFPTVNALDPTPGGVDYLYYMDAFVSKINATGSALVYSTYLGGPEIDYGRDIAVDSAGNAHVTGVAWEGFPTRNALQPWAGMGDVFVCKLTASGQALVYSTYLGGNDAESSPAIALDKNGHAYVTGSTESPNFPTASPWQSENPLPGKFDAFVVKLNANGTDLDWSSYLGGIDEDSGYDVAVDAAGTVHVTGDARVGFPIRGAAVQSSYAGDFSDAFIARITGPVQTSLRYRHNDFNDDGRADLLWHNASSGQNTLWRAAKSGIPRPVTRTASGWAIAGTGDFNGDHKADILWRNRATGANVIWKSGLSSSLQAVPTVNPSSWVIAGIGDFDNDGRSDIFWRGSGGANTIWKSANSATKQPTASIDPAWKVVGVADFNGDGTSDILWRHSTTGANTIWKSANSITQQAVTSVYNLQWNVAGIGDFDGDGKSDILWRNTVSGSNMVWKAAHSGTQQSVASVTDQAWKIVGVADFNGDDKSDILWRNGITGNNTIWKTANSTTQLAVTGVTNQAWQVAP